MQNLVCHKCGSDPVVSLRSASISAGRNGGVYTCKKCANRVVGVNGSSVCENPTRHFGKTCQAHPELKGERLKSNSSCVACHNAKRHRLTTRAYHANPEFREKYLIKKAKQKKDGDVYREQAASYRARKAQRTPVWSDRSVIRKIYKEAARRGLVVDHFFPLFGKTVSGLHVPANLRLVPQKENDRKSNKHPEEFYGRDYMKLIEHEYEYKNK